MKYHHLISLHRRSKHLKRVYIFFIVVAVVAGLVVLAIRLDSLLQDRVNTVDSTTTDQTSSYFASSNKVFTTKYFQFQTSKKWVEIPSESSDTEFIYRGQNKSIIEEELTIYVNSIPSDLTATRLLPVNLTAGGQELSPGSVSGHCHEASEEKNIDEKIVTFKKVTINCDIDNTQFNMLIGQTGGSTQLILNRPDGSEARYSMLYRSFEAIPDASEIPQIMQSFQTR